jgi:hypothetical protein
MCIAVGINAVTTGGLTETWDGHKWSIGNTPKGSVVFLADVACLNIDDCVAVGGQQAAPLVTNWNGRTWHVAATPRITNGILGGIALVGNFGVAVGAANSGERSLIEQR